MEGDSKTTYSDMSTGHIFLIQITIISDINIDSTAYKFEAKRCVEY
jgi:hypothetical protein